MPDKKIKIRDRMLSPSHPCYIVAELSGNHGHDFDRAVKIIEAAKYAGADAIKTQTYSPETMTIDCDREWFQIKGEGPWGGKTLFELYGEAFTPMEWQPKLKAVAEDMGLDFFSTPFDDGTVDFLEAMGVPIYKVASFEIVDIPLLRKIGSTGKPVIVSTGMSTFDEIGEAVSVLCQAGTEDIILLKCTSAYPASLEEMNLRTLNDMAEKFNVLVGLSDHTLGGVVAIAAVAMGASLVEKHLVLSRSDKGPDSAFSMEPAEFADMVGEIRKVEAAMGDISYAATDGERSNICFRRSVFVVEDIKAGQILSPENVRVIRPGFGLPPKFLPQILGRRASQKVSRGTPLSWGFIEDSEA